jgi:protocatechuate 3,4-dioxygenase beta subunit
MRRALPLLMTVGLLALVIGVVLWLLAAPTPRRGLPADARAPAPGPRPGPTTAPEPTPARTAAAKREPQAAAPEPAPAVEEGLVVTGTVLDRSGLGVAGARVVARHPGSGDRRQTTTQADGRFSLAGLAPDGWVLIAHHDDHQSSEPVQVAGGDQVLILGPGGVIAGTVRDHTGAPMPDAVVAAYAGRDRRREPAMLAGTDPAGQYRVTGLEPGVHQVCVTLSDRSVELCQTVTVPFDGEVRCDLGGAGWSRVQGQLLAPAPRPPHLEILENDDGKLVVRGRVAVQPDGSFELPFLEPGHHLVRFPGGFPLPLEVPPGGGTAEVQLDDPTGRITGQVARDDGGPVAGTRVRATLRGDEGRDERSALATADEGGRYRVTGLPAGVYDLFADAPDDARGTADGVELGAGLERHDVFIDVRLGGTLQVLLQDAGGRPVEGGAVWCQDALGFFFEVPATDTPGLHQLEGVGAGGTYRVLGGSRSQGLVWVERVPIRNHETREVWIELPGSGPSFEIGVTVAGEPAEGALVTITDLSTGHVVPDVTSPAFVAALSGNHVGPHGSLGTTFYPAGTYQVRVAFGAHDTREHVVTLGTEVTSLQVDF